jgi:hypothetical protein
VISLYKIKREEMLQWEDPAEAIEDALISAEAVAHGGLLYYYLLLYSAAAAVVNIV